MSKIKFTYTYSNTCQFFKIEGNYIKENVIRSEGHVEMSLKNDTLLIYSEDKNIHNDHKALIFMLTFYPVIPKNIECDLEFNFQVSKKFLNIIRRFPELNKINVDNVKLETSKYENIDTTICFGGGVDSTAVSILLPNLKKIQQINIGEINDNDDVISISSNIRDLYTRWGLPVWVTIFIFPLIKNSKYVLTGTQYNSAYLTNGKEYHELYDNLWYVLFRELNIFILSMSCISEITAAELVIKNNKCEKLEFCYFSARKRCNRCTKCLRKNLELSLFDEKYLLEIEKFDLSTIDFINFFNTDWLYFGDCFKFCVDYHLSKGTENRNILKLKSFLEKYDTSNVSFLRKYYEEDLTYMMFPDDLKEMIIYNLKINAIEKMSSQEVEMMKNYKNKKK